MELTLVGYFLKRTARPDGWLLPESVVEVCSVSDCINPSPDGWIDRWLHNELGFFNTRDDARTMVADPGPDFHLFAYRLLPLRFTKTGREPFSLPTVSPEPLTADFLSLGFDVVSKSVSDFFECSPLSCNGLAQETPVNRYCLVNTRTEAESLADRFAREEPEPGPYYVLEILREPELRHA